MIHLEVAVAAPLEQCLTYALSETLDSELGGAGRQNYVGRRVLVPLGKRKVTGYVLGVLPAPENSTYRIREVGKFFDTIPLFHQNIVPFYRWLANYYHYPLGLIIKTALPGGLSPGSVKILVLKTAPEELFSLLGKQAIPEWIRKLSIRGELGAAETGEILAGKNNKKLLKELVEKNAVVLSTVIQKDGVREKREVCFTFKSLGFSPPELSDFSPEGLQEVRKILSRDFDLDLKLSEARAFYILQQLTRSNNYKPIALKDLRKKYSGAAKALAGLEEKQLVLRSSERVFRSPFGTQLKFYPRPEQLTDEQQDALDILVPAIRAKKFKPFLLHGITGCGKTEVYLRAAEETLARGRDVLILVPEIALATQLEAHLLSRFGDEVVLLHSGLTASEKFDQFYLALSGKAKIVIGARSAIFAPLRDPGLIVVDEEHDTGFKQDDNFRYHGRDVAVLRAKHHNGVVLLGSATPSVTSYAHAESGKYTLLTMKERVGSSVLPVVTIVDLNKKQSKDNKRIIKDELLERLTGNITRGNQSILLLNRRGFSPVLLCQDCGTPVQCTHCHVSLTLHKEKNRLVCHYCGFTAANKKVCIQCRSENLTPAGFGTERVEQEVRELLPEARVKRLDSDTASNRKNFLAVLSEMHEGKIDILIGTQMIAKGHHFPNVTQVGVVWADGGMSMPDFRAAERTFQLITQVTGRAGRGDEPGEVLIQTMRPDHYAIVYARDHKYKEMFAHEMKLRQHPAFPPYVRLTGLRVQGRVENDVQQTAVQIARFCRQAVKKDNLTVQTLGPAPAPLDKIKDKYRWQVLLKGSSTKELHALCTALQSERNGLVRPQCSLAIDVDPENMM
jgi:primosomal protein N' (replication factor Y)